MSDKPRIAYATTGDPAHVHAPTRYLPIIIVPGIVGSRLTDPETGNLAWNPMGQPLGDSPGNFAADFERLAQLSAELVPDDTHVFDDGSDGAVQASLVKHYYHLIPDFYGALAASLAHLDVNLEKVGKKADMEGEVPLPIKPRVYCCGYDWRQDNAKSALRLAEVVEEALAETRERRVIIIAHSMGGLVARYYCRVLGGESKVHRLFLLGSPTLGAPNAYSNLKFGPPGLYPRDMVEDAQQGDPGAAVGEGIMAAGMVASGIEGAVSGASGGPMGVILGFIGDLYLALCLGSGRLLRRKETKWFARQLPGIYQLLPNSIYCSRHKNWLVFDPSATGYPPTGYMLVLPTMFDALAEICGDGFKKFFRPESKDRNSPRATRNMRTLEQQVKAFGDQQDTDAAHEGIGGLVGEIVARITATFVDCRNPKALYSDIYTGFLDDVDERALTAGHLMTALRFQHALIVKPKPDPSENVGEFLLNTLVLPGLSLIPGLDKLLKPKDKPKKPPEDGIEPNKVYMHPRTINFHCETFPVDFSWLLVPSDVYSNDDSNVVKSMSIPGSLAMWAISPLAAGSSFGDDLAQLATGDGTVPTMSSSPPAEVLSNPFLDDHSVPAVSHTQLSANNTVFQSLVKDIQALVPEFLAT